MRRALGLGAVAGGWGWGGSEDLGVQAGEKERAHVEDSCGSGSQMRRDLWLCQLWSMDHVRDLFLYFLLLLLYWFYSHMCLALG